MSELLSTVKSSFFHEVTRWREAESRLEGRVVAYLFWESDVKSGLFIILYVKNGSVSHLVTPNKDGKFIRQTLEEAVDIAADVIACSDSYHHPVPPPSPSDASIGSSGCASDKSRCYCCSFTEKDKRKLESPGYQENKWNLCSESGIDHFGYWKSPKAAQSGKM